MKSSLKKRNLWPTAIICYFALCITFIVSFTVFATRQRMDLVANDYYDQEIRFQKQVDRLTHTQPVRAEISINYDAVGQKMTLTLPRAHVQPNLSGHVQFYRPSDARLDREMQIHVDALGKQATDLKKFESGLWKVRVQWAADQQDYYFEKAIVIGS